MDELPSPDAVPWEQAEALRTPTTAGARDPRHGAATSLAVQHAEVASLVLSHHVPERIRIAFDTARNLYLYAWHVYRFYPVAELQALSTLEAGLRQALPSPLPTAYQPLHQAQPMLRGLLRYAIDEGLVRNEGFSRWHQRAEDRARQRQQVERLMRMVDQGLTEWAVDPNEPLIVTEEDRDWDLVAVLPQGLPTRRNAHAHGDGPLSPLVRGTLELVAEILNQLFADSDAAAPARAVPGASSLPSE